MPESGIIPFTSRSSYAENRKEKPLRNSDYPC
jgi:hypothetical protein